MLALSRMLGLGLAFKSSIFFVNFHFALAIPVVSHKNKVCALHVQLAQQSNGEPTIKTRVVVFNVHQELHSLLSKTKVYPLSN